MRSKSIYILILVLLALALPAAAQRPNKWWNPTIPFDFSNAYYKTYGVIPDMIQSRRDGRDGISVIDKAPFEMFANVRVLATVPAYDQNGYPMFWFPLGDLRSNGFTPDDLGLKTKETARTFPIFIFPDPRLDGFTTFTGHRHAPLIDLRERSGYPTAQNPLGIRAINVVNYTQKARSKEGWEMMQFFGKKNGWAVDDTPILKSLDDMYYLEKMGYVLITPLTDRDLMDPSGGFTIAPMFDDPTSGAIYPDAILLMTLKDGRPLLAEQIFEWQFVCLQKIGNYCENPATPDL